MSPRIALPIAALALAACHGCREDHPYVPYTIAPGATPAGLAGTDASAASAAGTAERGDGGPSRFYGEPARLAPPETSQWPLDGVVLDAPPGHVFVAGIARDFDGDGVTDAFVILRDASGAGDDQAAYYSGKAGAPSLGAPTTFAPSVSTARDAGCSPVDRLVAVSPRSVYVELGASCAAGPSVTPDRWLAVLAGGAPPTVRLAATVVDPPGAGALSVDADTADRDGDGLDDVALHVTLEGGSAPFEPGPRVTATIAWLDRPAGLSRDVSATESSFAALASAATKAARSKETSPTVAPLVTQARALYRAICREGGSPRLVGVAGAGAVTCGPSRALEAAGLAEVRAYAAQGDALRAALALDRAEHPPAVRTSARESEAQAWIGQVAPISSAVVLRAVAAFPAVRHGHEPSWGPLTFDGGGKLLMLSRAGIVRVDPDDGAEQAADGVTEWGAAVASPDRSTRWIETYDPCDGLPVQATFSTQGGDDLRDVALPVAAPLGEHCVGSRGAPVRAMPVAWGAAGLEAIVEGEAVLVSSDLSRVSPLAAWLGQPFTPGAPRSPDGAVLVVPSGVGLVVTRGGRARIFRATELDGTYGEQQDCAVDNAGIHVACVHAGRAWVGTWPPG